MTTRGRGAGCPARRRFATDVCVMGGEVSLGSGPGASRALLRGLESPAGRCVTRRVLALLATALLSAAVEPEARPLPLRLHAAAFGGAVVLDSDRDAPDGGRPGPLLGVTVGLRADRPPLVEGGSTFSFFPSLELRHATAAQRTEWLGRFSVGTSLARLFLVLLGVGYGLSTVGGIEQRPLAVITTALALPVGPVLFLAGSDMTFHLDNGGRSVDLRLGVAFELDVAAGR